MKLDPSSNMKLIIAISLFVTVSAAPRKTLEYDYPVDEQVSYDSDVHLLRYENDNDGGGSFRYAYEQSDGQRAEAQGELKNEGREDESLVIVGSYSWVGPDGVTYIVKYVADENGYRPVNEHRPDYVSQPGQSDFEHVGGSAPPGPSGPGGPAGPAGPAPDVNLDLLRTLVGAG